MCRFIAYSGEPLLLEDVLYRPSNSLIHQAADAMESRTRINADGFGIGWYQPELSDEPAVFKDVTPAWNDANLRSLAGKVASPCILAHVRAARRDDLVCRVNCHPFQRGRLLWMHNGGIPDRGRLHRRVAAETGDAAMAQIEGSTDSELAYTLFLDLLETLSDRSPTPDELARAMRRTVERIVVWWREDGDERFLALNFCVTDGRCVVATRMARAGEPLSLHYCTGSRYVCRDGRYRIEAPEPGRRCAMVTSEVLSQDARWEIVPPDGMVVVREDRSVEVRPLDLP